MRALIAITLRLLLIITTFISLQATAEPSPNDAPGVEAYEAGDYERAYELLKPGADAGDTQARYLVAMLLSQKLLSKID